MGFHDFGPSGRGPQSAKQHMHSKRQKKARSISVGGQRSVHKGPWKVREVQHTSGNVGAAAGHGYPQRWVGPGSRALLSLFRSVSGGSLIRSVSGGWQQDRSLLTACNGCEGKSRHHRLPLLQD